MYVGNGGIGEIDKHENLKRGVKTLNAGAGGGGATRGAHGIGCWHFLGVTGVEALAAA